MKKNHDDVQRRYSYAVISLSRSVTQSDVVSTLCDTVRHCDDEIYIDIYYTCGILYAFIRLRRVFLG